MSLHIPPAQAILFPATIALCIGLFVNSLFAGGKSAHGRRLASDMVHKEIVASSSTTNTPRRLDRWVLGLNITALLAQIFAFVVDDADSRSIISLSMPSLMVFWILPEVRLSRMEASRIVSGNSRLAEQIYKSQHAVRLALQLSVCVYSIATKLYAEQYLVALTELGGLVALLLGNGVYDDAFHPSMLRGIGRDHTALVGDDSSVLCVTNSSTLPEAVAARDIMVHDYEKGNMCVIALKLWLHDHPEDEKKIMGKIRELASAGSNDNVLQNAIDNLGLRYRGMVTVAIAAVSTVLRPRPVRPCILCRALTQALDVRIHGSVTLDRSGGSLVRKLANMHGCQGEQDINMAYNVKRPLFYRILMAYSMFPELKYWYKANDATRFLMMPLDPYVAAPGALQNDDAMVEEKEDEKKNDGVSSGMPTDEDSGGPAAAPSDDAKSGDCGQPFRFDAYYVANFLHRFQFGMVIMSVLQCLRLADFPRSHAWLNDKDPQALLENLNRLDRYDKPTDEQDGEDQNSRFLPRQASASDDPHVDEVDDEKFPQVQVPPIMMRQPSEQPTEKDMEKVVLDYVHFSQSHNMIIFAVESFDSESIHIRQQLIGALSKKIVFYTTLQSAAGAIGLIAHKLASFPRDSN